MDRTAFHDWLVRYVDAWRLNDPTAIGDLFSQDVRYAFDPFDEAVVGRPAVVAALLTDIEESGAREAAYEVLAIDGNTYVAHGRTRYLTDDGSVVDHEFANIFVCRFDDDGRCREFTEWYMRRRPDPLAE